LASSCGDEPLPLNPLNPSQSETGGVLAEVDQMISSLESDLMVTPSSAQLQPLSSTNLDHSNLAMTQEPLPAIVLDDGHDDARSQNSQSSVSLTAVKEQMEEREIQQIQTRTTRPTRGRNLLDQNHILNLEECLASLPVPERIQFVQGVMTSVNGLEDLMKQGLTVVAKPDPDKNGGSTTTHSNQSTTSSKPDSASENLSRARQVVESGIDTSLLSELESLLSRVGLRIQLDSQKSTCGNGRQSSTAVSSKIGRGNNSRKKNRVEIEMEA